MNIGDRLDLARGKDLTLGVLLERSAEIYGDRRLVEDADSGLTLTAVQAADLVDRWAGAIAAETEPGDRVVLATPNGYQQFLLTAAAARAGRLAAPVNSHMARAEIDHVIADSGAAMSITDPDDLDTSKPHGPAVATTPREVAALFYTSGTTGKPKGARLTHASLFGGYPLTALLPRRTGRDEAVLGLPVAHIYGFTMLVAGACGGIPLYFFSRFNPVKAMDAIEQRASTIFAGVPAMYRMMLEAGAAERDLSSIRVWISGADAMPPELAAKFKKFGSTMKLPVVGSVGEALFAEGYGMVETGGGVAIKISPPLLPTTVGGMGIPLPGNHFKVVDEHGEEVPRGKVGELLLKGPGVLKGYHGSPEATADALTPDGWLRTGDLARRGAGGLVTFEGRMKDVIKRGGYSVYAVEVEQSLEEHPDIVEAAVVPMADSRDGEVPVAVLGLREGVTLDEAELAAWCRDRLSAYKVPARFIEIEDFPRTGTDKIQRKAVIEYARETLG